MSLQLIREHASAIGPLVDALERPPEPETPTVDVGLGDNLLDALEQAPAGAIVRVDPSFETDIGVVTLRKPVRITTAGPLPPGRITPAAQLPTLRGASLTFAAPDIQLAGLKVFGQGGTMVTTGERTLLDRVVLLGRGTAAQHRGVAANSVDVTIVDAHIADIWKDIDTQAVWCYAFTRNLKILRSYLEASGENFMSGGADGPDEASIPDGILIDDCDLEKPTTWRDRGDIGNKNLFEVKNGRNITLRRSRLKRSWADAQGGNAIVISVRNQNGRATWSCIENVVMEDLEVNDVGGLLAVLGRDTNYASGIARNLLCRRWNVRGLSWVHAEPGRAASGRPFTLMGGPQSVILEDINVESDYARSSATLHFENYTLPVNGLELRRCRLPEGNYGLTGTVPGVPVGVGQLAGHAPAYVWEDMTIVRPPNPVRTPVYPEGTTRIPFPTA